MQRTTRSRSVRKPTSSFSSVTASAPTPTDRMCSAASCRVLEASTVSSRLDITSATVRAMRPSKVGRMRWVRRCGLARALHPATLGRPAANRATQTSPVHHAYLAGAGLGGGVGSPVSAPRSSPAPAFFTCSKARR